VGIVASGSIHLFRTHQLLTLADAQIGLSLAIYKDTYYVMSYVLSLMKEKCLKTIDISPLLVISGLSHLTCSLPLRTDLAIILVI